jgi:VWFA-related protein
MREMNPIARGHRSSWLVAAACLLMISTLAAQQTAPPQAQAVPEENGYVLHKIVEEVVLNATVLDGKGNLVLDLKPEEFRVLEDGVQQKIRGFQRQDLPVSIGLVVDNSGSMSRKRQSVATAVLDLIKASNPDDEAFVVNFNDRAYLDQAFTNDPGKLRDAIVNLHSEGTTALYDAVVASADELAKHASRAKQVLIVITDGEDNDSQVTLEECIRKVQQLEGPVVYSIGLLFGDEMSKNESRHARKALELLSEETGGIAYEPRALNEVDSIAAEVARDIRSQYTIGYASSKPYSLDGYRRLVVEVKSKRYKKLFVRTRPGYFPRGSAGSPQVLQEKK